MTTTEPIAELLYSEQDLTPISTDEATLKPWAEAQACLAAAPKIWLSTARPDGRPHSMPVLLATPDDILYFAARPGSRKAKNLAHNPHCVITVGSDTLDLVVEGEVTQVTSEAEMVPVAAAFKSKYDWELTIRDGFLYENNVPGSFAYAFYRITPTRAFGYGADGLTATRWRF